MTLTLEESCTPCRRRIDNGKSASSMVNCSSTCARVFHLRLRTHLISKRRGLASGWLPRPLRHYSFKNPNRSELS